MFSHIVLLSIACAILGIVRAAAQSPPTSSFPTPQFSTPDPVFQYIAQCLSLGAEIIMVPQATCVPYETGGNTLQKLEIPLKNTDSATICLDRANPRRLYGDIFKRLAAQNQHPIAPTGIRILGAVFCEDIDLVGLSVPYSVVIDYSVVRGTINARNFHTRNDFSFENSFIFSSLTLTRALIEGSIYGSASFVQKLTATDTKVGGTWRFNNAIIFDDARLSQVSIAGDFLFNGSALSWFWLQSSRINGALELNDTEVRCAYHINASTVGYITASNAGFGIIKTMPQTGSRPAVDYAWWNRAVAGGAANPQKMSFVREMFATPVINKILKNKENTVAPAKGGKVAGPVAIYGCEPGLAATDLEFLVTDTSIGTAVCVTSFHWTMPKGSVPDKSHPSTILALREIKVGGSLSLRPWVDSTEGPYAAALSSDAAALSIATRTNKLEAIGVKAGVFVYDFTESIKPYSNYLDELSFSRIQNSTPDCNQKSAELLGSATVSSQGHLPTADNAMRWLASNQVNSSQPFTVFIQAFETAGLDATDLRIRRAARDLIKHTRQDFSFASTDRPRVASSIDLHRDAGLAYMVFGSATALFSASAEFIGIVFQWLMWGVADFGYRPAKVVWSVFLVLVLFWGWCWFNLRIVGFEPKKKEEGTSAPAGRQTPGQSTKPDIWPVGFLFFFDHLIPAYQIRSEHYSIERVFCRLRAKKAANVSSAANSDAAPTAADARKSYPLTYFGFPLLIRSGDDADHARLESCLTVVRVIGIALSVFVLAAINALIAK
jgi:hypothetical protein